MANDPKDPLNVLFQNQLKNLVKNMNHWIGELEPIIEKLNTRHIVDLDEETGLIENIISQISTVGMMSEHAIGIFKAVECIGPEDPDIP